MIVQFYCGASPDLGEFGPFISCEHEWEEDVPDEDIIEGIACSWCPKCNSEVIQYV